MTNKPSTTNRSKKFVIEQKTKIVRKHLHINLLPKLGVKRRNPIPSANPDRRIARTREMLMNALSALMIEKRYDDITVQDILDRANVGRSTFYAHFQDKEDLAMANLFHILDSLARAMEKENSDPQHYLPGRDLFEHIREHYSMFKAMTSGRGLDLFFQKGQEYWSERVALRLQAMLLKGQESSVPIPILAHYVSGMYVTLLKWWIDNKMPYTSDRMAEIVEQLVTPSVQAGLFGKK